MRTRRETSAAAIAGLAIAAAIPAWAAALPAPPAGSGFAGAASTGLASARADRPPHEAPDAVVVSTDGGTGLQAAYGFGFSGTPSPSIPSSLASFTPSPLTLNGDFEIGRVRHNVPRGVQDPEGLSCVELPSGDRVFRYGDTVSGTYGLAIVRAGGAVSILLETQGAPSDPFPASLAASPDGALLALAPTQPLVDLGTASVLLVRTDGTTFGGGNPWVDVGPPGGFVAADARSLRIRAADLLFTDGGTLFRAPLDGSGPAAVVALPPSGGSAPAWIGGSFACSWNGAWAAIVAGASPTANDVYVVDATGVASNATQAPSAYLEADTGTGMPRLAVADDGQIIGFTARIAQADEVFLGAVATASAVQLTQDANFVDTIDSSIGLIPTFGGSLVFVAGEQNEGDLFQASLAPGGGAVIQNLSLTSGEPQPPFTVKGSLGFSGLFLSPDGTTSYFVADDKNAQNDSETFLLAVDLAAETMTNIPTGLADQLTLLTGAVGSDVTYLAHADAAGGTTRVRRFRANDPTLPLQTIATFPAAIVPAALACTRDGGHLALVAGTGPSQQLVLVGSGATAGALVPLPLPPGSVTTSLRFNDAGRLALGIGPSASLRSFLAVSFPWTAAPGGMRPLATGIAGLAVPPGAGSIF